MSTRLWLFVKRHAFPHHLTPYFYCSFANPRLITKFPFLTAFSSFFKDPHFWTRDFSLKSFWATPYSTSVIMKLIESSLHYKQVCFVCWSISEESISNVFFSVKFCANHQSIFCCWRDKINKISHKQASLMPKPSHWDPHRDLFLF